MKILFVGDSERLLQTVSVILKVRWPELSLVHATEIREAIELVYKEQPDIVMLHHPEPGEGSTSVDCFELISQIRSFSDIPIVVLSDSDDVIDKVKALEMGADDWFIRSYGPMEFTAKVNAVLRRCLSHDDKLISCFINDNLSINYATHEVCVLGKQVKLTSIECKILSQLVNNEGRIVSCTELLHSGWGPDYRADPEFLKKYIYRLRSKIEEDPAKPQIILTERGMGYSFIEPCNSNA